MIVRKSAWAGLAAACGAAAMPALANTGVGLMMHATPVMVVALVPAILIEAPILARFLKVSLRRGLWLSFVANLVSTFLGTVIAFVASLVIPIGSMDVSREMTLVSLLPMLFVSWWLEAMMVRNLEPPERAPSVRKATGVANAVTYALMAVGAAILVPAGDTVFSRWKLTEPINEMMVARTEVAEHFQRQREFPPPRTFPAKGKYVRSITLEAGGRVVLTLSFPGSPEADGKRIVHEPRVAGGEIVEWRCHSPDMAAKYLPAACR